MEEITIALTMTNVQLYLYYHEPFFFRPKVSECPYLLIWVLKLTLWEKLEGADGEAACLTQGRGWPRIQ